MGFNGIESVGVSSWNQKQLIKKKKKKNVFKKRVTRTKTANSLTFNTKARSEKMLKTLLRGFYFLDDG